MRFDIEAQSLPGALTAFGQQSGYQVSVDRGDLAGLSAPDVSGRMTPEEALQRLLAGSGVTWRFSDDRSVVLSRVADGQSGTLTIGPVTVEGQGETAWGPVKGYVAERTATGTKTDTPLREIPQSVTVITGDQLEDMGARDMNEALRHVPGVNAEAQGHDMSDTYSIRGFIGDQSEITVDGMRHSGSLMSRQELFAFERVEVLRGPASILYGDQEPGGTINAVLKRPLSDPFIELSGEVGSFNRKQATFDATGPIDEDKQFLYRVTALGRDSDFEIDFVRDNRKFLMPQIEWRPSSATSVTLRAEYDRHDTNRFLRFPASGTLLDNPNGSIPRDRFLGIPDFSDWEKERISFGFDLDQQLGSIFTLRQTARYAHNDMFLDNSSQGTLAADQRTWVRRDVERTVRDQDVFTSDSQLLAKWDTGPIAHTTLAGFDYHRDSLDRQDIEAVGGTPTIDLFDPNYSVQVAPTLTGNVTADTNTTTERKGVYLQEQAKLYDRYVVMLNARHDWYDAESVNRLAPANNSEHDQKAFTWRGGVAYLGDWGLTPYFSYAESFQPENELIFPGTPTEPTLGEQKELGLRWEPPGYDARINIALFEIKKTNIAVDDPDHNDFVLQIGELTSRGIEFEGRANLPNGLDLIGTFTWNDVKVTETDPNSTADGLELGKTPTRVPKVMATAWAIYNWRSGLLDGLYAGGGMRYTGKTFGDSANSREMVVPSRIVLDAALGYQQGPWDFQLSVINLLDKDYVASCQSTSQCWLGQPLTVNARATFRW